MFFQIKAIVYRKKHDRKKSFFSVDYVKMIQMQSE